MYSISQWRSFSADSKGVSCTANLFNIVIPLLMRFYVFVSLTQHCFSNKFIGSLSDKVYLSRSALLQNKTSTFVNTISLSTFATRPCKKAHATSVIQLCSLIFKFIVETNIGSSQVFAVSVPTLWNSLNDDVKSAGCWITFRLHLKADTFIGLSSTVNSTTAVSST